MQRIGLIGSGYIASVHASVYANVDGAKVTAVASIDEDVEQFVEEYAPGADIYTDAKDLIRDGGVDAVDICTPTHTHSELIQQFARAGYDILCEKPLCRTLESANAIEDAVEENGVTCMVGHSVRFRPAFRRAKELVERGEIGEPGVVHTSRMGQAPDWGFDDWYADVERGGGVLLDLVVHDFDFLRWTLGEVDRVFTRSSQWRDGDRFLDHSVASLRFERGTVAHVEGSWAQPSSREFAFSFEFAGDDGVVEFDGHNSKPLQHYQSDGASVTSPLRKSDKRLEIEHFLTCLANDGEPEITLTDAIEALRISLAAIESADRDEPVVVSEVTA